MTANFKKLTVWGNIIITLLQEGDNVKIVINSGAYADNIFTLFFDPNKKIADRFRNNLLV